MTKGTSFDTRFMVELFYTSDPLRQSKIREILVGSRPNYISTAALSEIYQLSLEKEGRDVAQIRAKSLYKDFRMAPLDGEIAIEAEEIRRRRPIPFVDSVIAATAKILKVPCYTDDPHFDIDGLTVRWMK